MLIFKKIIIIISLFTILNLIAGCTHIPNPPQESQESTETINETTEPTDSYTMVIVGHPTTFYFECLSDFYLHAENPKRNISEYTNPPFTKPTSLDIPSLILFEDIFPYAQATEFYPNGITVGYQYYYYHCYNFFNIHIKISNKSIQNSPPDFSSQISTFDDYLKVEFEDNCWIHYEVEVEPDIYLLLTFRFMNEIERQEFLENSSIPQLVSIYEGDQEAIDAFVATVKQLGSGNSEQ
jgi:hypothetical protein